MSRITADQIAKEDAQQAEHRPGKYMIVWNEGGKTIYVKDADYFKEQGGETAEWGKRWIKVTANSINDAREKGHALRREAQAESESYNLDYKVKVTTKWDEDVIKQEVKIHSMSKLMPDFNKTIIDTREKHIRKALISLGWTPPADSNG